MGPSNVRRFVLPRALFFHALLILTLPIAVRAQHNLLPAADDLGAAPGEAEIQTQTQGIGGAANSSIEQDLRSVDRALVQAFGANDRLAARLLDSEFTWVDRDGRSRSKSELANGLILLAAGPDANLAFQNYGRVALLTGTHRLAPDNAPAVFARVWVRRPSGWRLLLYQETTPPDASVRDANYGVTRADWPARCDNPCRSLPYKPLSPEAQEIVASFMAGEKADFDADAETASRILGDDFFFVTPDRQQPMDKAQRIAAIRKFRREGPVDPPPAVVSMALWVFGNAAVMSADEEAPSGERMRATRIWAKRAGLWQITFSQQTLVQ
jgi:uncharacterized protein DUF4440